MSRKVFGLLTVRAIGGTHVVFLASRLNESVAKRPIGFAIRHTDPTDDIQLARCGSRATPQGGWSAAFDGLYPRRPAGANGSIRR